MQGLLRHTTHKTNLSSIVIRSINKKGNKVKIWNSIYLITCLIKHVPHAL